MKNLLKLFGLIALVAIIGFGFAACGPGAKGDDTPVDLTIHISKTDGGAAVTVATVNESLWAVCAEGANSYQWEKDGTEIGGATYITYKPTEAGSYTVVVYKNSDSARGKYYNYTTSAVVTVSAE